MEDVVNAVEGAAVGNLGQSKQHTKQNGAISTSPQAKSFQNSPVGETLTGNFSQVLPTIKNDVSNLNTQVGKGNPGTLMGLTGVDTPIGEGETPGEVNGSMPSGTKLVNQGVKGNADLEPQAKSVNPQILDAKGNPTTSTTQEPTLPKINPQQVKPEPEPQPEMLQPQYSDKAAANRQKYYDENTTTPSKSDINANQQRNLPLDDHNITSIQAQKRVNATLNRYGIKGSATQQKEMQENTINMLSNNAQKQIASDVAGDPAGNSTTAEDLTNEIYANMVNNPGKYQIPQSQLKTQIGSYLSRVYARATGNTGITAGSAIPDTIPDTIVYKMKQLMNQDAKTTYSQPDPTKWNVDQQLSHYGRDAFDDVIDAKHPEVSGINSDTADLFKADGALKKGVNTENTATAKGMGKFGKFGIGVGGTVGAVLGGMDMLKFAGIDPVKAAEFVGASGYQAGKNAVDFLTGNKSQSQNPNIPNKNSNQNQLGHGSIMTPFDTNVNSMSALPTSPDQIALNQDGSVGMANVYTWKDQNNNPLFADPTKIQADGEKLTAILQTPAYNSSTLLQAQARGLQNQIANETQFSKPINDNFQKYKTGTSLFNQTIVDSQKAGLDISNYNGSYNDLLNQISSKNTLLAQDLQKLKAAGLIGEQVSFTGTLTGALQRAAQSNLVEFYNIVGGQNPTAIGQGATTPQGQTTAGAITPTSPMPKINYSQGAPQNQQLPPMPNFQQIGSQFAQ